MPKTIFDFISDISINKSQWNEFDESEKKQWSNYMINRWLSMDMSLINLVSETQKLTMEMPPAMSYLFYTDFLPKKKLYLKYVKSTSSKEKELANVVTHLSAYLNIPENEASEYVAILLDTNKKEELIEFIEKFGYDSKQTKKFFK